MDREIRTAPIGQFRLGGPELRAPVYGDRLEKNIAEHGVVKPLIVEVAEDDFLEEVYLISDGLQRYRAALSIGLTELPYVVRKI